MNRGPAGPSVAHPAANREYPGHRRPGVSAEPDGIGEIPPAERPLSIEEVARPGALSDEELGPLSAYFAAFLPHFVDETLRTGGRVTALRGRERLEGIFLRRDRERLGSIFASDAEAARALYSTREELTAFAEYPLDPSGATYPVLLLELTDRSPEHRFVHSIRSARPDDRPRIAEVLRAVYGSVDEAWLAADPSPAERALVGEIDGRLVAAAWVTVVGRDARLHSLSVVPRYRRLGLGTDLWHARVLAARTLGATRAITEIAETNAASLAISTRGGMRRIGQVYENRR